MTNMPGMFALRAWESRERPRERHRWHLINTPAPLFEQKQVPGAGPRGGSYPHPGAGCQRAQWCQPSTRAPAVPWGAHHPSGEGGPALRLHPGQPHAQTLPGLQGKKLQSRAAAAGDAMGGVQLPGVRLPPACPKGVPASCPGPPHPSRAPPLAPSKTLPREASSWEELKATRLVLFRILVFAPRKELPPRPSFEEAVRSGLGPGLINSPC